MQDYKIVGDLMKYGIAVGKMKDTLAIHIVYVSKARQYTREDILHHYGLSDTLYEQFIAHYETHRVRLDEQATTSKNLQNYLARLSKPATDEIDYLEKLLYDPLNFVRSSAAQQLVETLEPRAIQAVIRGFLNPIDSEDLEDVGDISSCTSALKRGGADAVRELIP